MNRLGNDYIVIYVCLTPNCGGYYGSGTMPEMENEPVLAPLHAKDAGEIRHMRSRCPACGHERHRRWAKIMSAEASATIDQARKSGVVPHFQEHP